MWLPQSWLHLFRVTPKLMQEYHSSTIPMENWWDRKHPLTYLFPYQLMTGVTTSEMLQIHNKRTSALRIEPSRWASVWTPVVSTCACSLIVFSETASTLDLPSITGRPCPDWAASDEFASAGVLIRSPQSVVLSSNIYNIDIKRIKNKNKTE